MITGQHFMGNRLVGTGRDARFCVSTDGCSRPAVLKKRDFPFRDWFSVGRRMYTSFDFPQGKPGSAPGIEHDEIQALPSAGQPARITCTDYCASRVAVQEVIDIQSFLTGHRPIWSVVRWINVDGLEDMTAIHALATKYDLHPLAIEDLVHCSQRPKVDQYGGEDSEMQARLFIIARTLDRKSVV